MRRRIIAGLTAAAVLSGALLLAHRHGWLSRFIDFVTQHAATFQALGAIVAMAVVGFGLLKWVFPRRQPPASAERAELKGAVGAQAGRDIVAPAEGSTAQVINTGGATVPGSVIQVGTGTVNVTQTVIPPPQLHPLHQLPPAPADFTGREDELNELLEHLQSGGAAISGLQGLGGVGKTALALKLAEQLEKEYAGAQIYFDLRGVSPNPATPAEAMAHVVRAYQPEAKLPENEAELPALYCSVLHGQRALLLMDNACDAAQVRPLVPPAGCALVVTSRQHFVVPGLYAKNLETLPAADAQALLLRIAPRIDGEAGSIAALCGYLPLALEIAASTLAARADLAPADFAGRLRNQKDRLKVLKAGDQNVEASIGLSYDLLDGETQKRWRSLAVFPETFEEKGAAAVWKLEPEGAKDLLSGLLARSLLEFNPSTSRYRLHDLVRVFAGSRLEPGERAEAERRHAAHYKDVLATANRLFLQKDAVLRGLALFDAEWVNIRAGQAWAVAHAEEDREAARLASAYPNAGVYCLMLRQHPREWIAWLESALKAARRLKDRGAEGVHLGNLGLAYARLGETRRAIEYYEQRLAIAHEIGDRRGEGNALGSLGLAYADLGETRRAIEYHEQYLAISREIGDRRGEGNALGSLGLAYADLGETRRAIEYHEQYLAIAREIGDRRGEGNALGNLGNVYADLGETRHAIEYYEQDLTISREIGDRRGQGAGLGNLGNAYDDLGETGRALKYYEQQLSITREIGDRRGESIALWNMSLALDKLGRRAEAVAHAEAALKIRDEIEDPDAAKVRKQLEEWKGGAG